MNSYFGVVDFIYLSFLPFIIISYIIIFRRTFRTAMRRNNNFQAEPDDVKEQCFLKMKYIIRIYENWALLRANVVDTGIDIRGFPLWKLYKCINIDEARKQANRRSIRRRPTRRLYPAFMIDDVVNNQPAATERVLNHVHRDEEQVKLIGKDVAALLEQRANGELWSRSMKYSQVPARATNSFL